MKNQLISWLGLGLLAVFALACASDGAAGPAGSTSAVDQSVIDAAVASGVAAAVANGTITSSSANTSAISKVEISSVDMNATTGKTKVTFILKDKNDAGLGAGGNVSKSAIRFALARLIPGTNGEPDKWEDYITRTRTSTTYPGVTISQGTTETATGGNLTYVGKVSGQWTYEFSSANVIVDSSKFAQTHRVAMQVTGMTSNPTKDFRPDAGPIALTKSVVHEDICNDCHAPLRIHGSRYTADYCVTCHNPSTVAFGKEFSGNVVKSYTNSSGNTALIVSADFQNVVHKVHTGKNLPSITSGAGGNYIYGTTSYLKSFPRDTGMRDCTNCHKSTSKTPDYANYQTKPSMEACGSCHDSANFATGTGFKSIASHKVQTNNSECATCHKPADIIAYHDTKARKAITAGEYVKYNLISAGNTTPGANAYVIFTVTNPKLATTDAAYYYSNVTTDSNINPITFRLAYSGNSNGSTGGDWDNYFENGTLSKGTSSGNYQGTMNVSVSKAVSIGSNQYKATFTAPIPAGAVGPAIIGTDGHPKYLFPGETVATSANEPNEILAIAITGTEKGRRTIVDNNKCMKCHGHLAGHGAGRLDEVQLCAVCHNPNMADNMHRVERQTLTSGTGSGNLKISGGSANTIVGGKMGESLDMKTMIHGLHAPKVRTSPYTVYRTRSGTSYEYVFDANLVEFPGEVSNCLTCHKDTTGSTQPTYAFPLSAKLVGSTIYDVTQSNNNISGVGEDTKITPAASVCSACHDSAMARAHMVQNGANFATTQTAIQAAVSAGNVLETCETCHGPGKTADVKTVHGIK